MLNKVLQTFQRQLWQQRRHPYEGPLHNSFFLKEGYQSRSGKEYFDDSVEGAEGIVHQPDVYAFAAFLGRRLGCSYMVDVGCGRARKLVHFYPEFHVVGIDHGPNIEYCQVQYPFEKWIDLDLERESTLPLDRRLLRNAVIVCADVIEHLNNPFNLLKILKTWLRDAPTAILTTPERDLVYGLDNLGPPANPCHVREWNLVELEKLLKSMGFKISFSGLTANNNRDREKKTSIVVLENHSRPEIATAPDGFRVVAFMTAYNEKDIIVPSISNLAEQGVEVYLIDNWSTDGTYGRAQSLLGKGLIGIERYPPEGPTRYYEWKRLLRRVEGLTQQIPANWFIHHDADEVRESPWPGVRLKDAIYHADRMGFNAIDHTVVVFPPVDNSYIPGRDFKSHFSFFEFGRNPGHFRQIKAWKNVGQSISLVDSGGHDVEFHDRRVYPYKFLLRHYPIRSQAHGERKVFVERQQRFLPEEKNQGWHVQYDGMAAGHVFIKSRAELLFFAPKSFYKDYLVERLSGIGIIRKSITTERDE